MSVSHHDVVKRAVRDRLALYEGCNNAERGVERERFISETADMVIAMILRGTPEIRDVCVHFSPHGEDELFI